MGDYETVEYTDYDIYRGWSVTEGAARALDEALARVKLLKKDVGAEFAHLSAPFYCTLVNRVGKVRDVEYLLTTLRRIKDPQEVAQIELNVAVNDRAFIALRESLSPGMTGLDVASIVYQTLCEAQGHPLLWNSTLVLGPWPLTPMPSLAMSASNLGIPFSWTYTLPSMATMLILCALLRWEALASSSERYTRSWSWPWLGARPSYVLGHLRARSTRPSVV